MLRPMLCPSLPLPLCCCRPPLRLLDRCRLLRRRWHCLGVRTRHVDGDATRRGKLPRRRVTRTGRGRVTSARHTAAPLHLYLHAARTRHPRHAHSTTLGLRSMAQADRGEVLPARTRAVRSASMRHPSRTHLRDATASPAASPSALACRTCKNSTRTSELCVPSIQNAALRRVLTAFGSVRSQTASGCCCSSTRTSKPTTKWFSSCVHGNHLPTCLAHELSRLTATIPTEN